MLHFSKFTAAMLVAASFAVGAARQTVLKSSDTHPDGYPTVEGVQYFGELVKERTAGRYAVGMRVRRIKECLGPGSPGSERSGSRLTAAANFEKVGMYSCHFLPGDYAYHNRYAFFASV